MAKLKHNEISLISDVAKDIIRLKFNETMTIKECRNMFYKVMRKHGIKQGTKSKDGNGVLCNNFEWTMCNKLFLDRFISNMEFDGMFNEDLPKDLRCY